VEVGLLWDISMMRKLSSPRVSISMLITVGTLAYPIMTGNIDTAKTSSIPILARLLNLKLDT
jgi:hypothetical protein